MLVRNHWSKRVMHALGLGDDRSVAPPRARMDRADRRQLFAVVGTTLLVIILGLITFVLTT